MNKDRGFSVFKLLYVVATLWIIVSFADRVISRLLIHGDPAPESSAVANIRTINTAQEIYRSSTGVYGDFVNLYSLGLIDGRWSESTTPAVSGYAFTLALGTAGSYTILASPTRTHGRCAFASSEDGVVTYSTDMTGCPGTAGNPVQ